MQNTLLSISRVSLLVVFAAVFLSGCGLSAPDEVSGHFDGKRFRNPTLKTEYNPTVLEVFRMEQEDRPAWPPQVENQGVPKLDTVLAKGDASLTFVNHATFLIQFQGINVLTDPVWSDNVGPLSALGLKRIRLPGIRFEDLPKIDVIVISHNHYDHLDLETIKKLNERDFPKVLVPKGDKVRIESVGVQDVQELDWWEKVQIDSDTNIVFTPSQHSSRRGLFDLNKSLWGSYYIRHARQSVYFGGDAGYSSHYADIKEHLGAPDIALLPIGDYLPDWFMRPMHMNPAEAVAAHQDLGTIHSIGMHFDTFQNSSVAFCQPQKELAVALKDKGISEDMFVTLAVGETRIYSKDRRFIDPAGRATHQTSCLSPLNNG